MQTIHRSLVPLGLAVLLLLGVAALATASSHREAPFVAEHPQIDATDLYMFRSYEAGRDGYITILANYHPLQEPYGGPNYFALDDDARYVIHIDNDGDGVEDLSFSFAMNNLIRAISIPVGGTSVAVPLKNIGPISQFVDPELNFVESYEIRLIEGAVDDPSRTTDILQAGGGTFIKPVDNIGTKSIPDYDTYEDQYVFDIAIPGCADGRVFVGQRREGFGVNLGEIFDLINTDPVGDPDGENSATEFTNVTTFALELPIGCVKGSGDVIGAWTTAWLPRVRQLQPRPNSSGSETPLGSLASTSVERTPLGAPVMHAARELGPFRQVSRLGMPLVNEVVIGLPDKDRFNTSAPKDDLQFATYVTNPTLPELIEILFPVVEAPNNFPRNDLLATFVTGIDGVNLFGFGEMLRLNTSIPPTPAGSQNNLGVVAGDLAGFPNGRRPGDDVVDIELRVAMGLLCHAGLGLCEPSDAPSGTLPYTDGVTVDDSQFDDVFPYLTTPIPGSPNALNGIGEKP
ncbi:MAG: DUF4331 domain-containing protein [Thermoanaerobaculia bacterium]|nr:DUF4331 domain-containing protein [Thermoanaerobaculia bacterium]